MLAPRIVIATALAIPFIGSAVAARPDWKRLDARPGAWYRGAEGLKVTANILSHQSTRGGWPKNLDTTADRFQGDSKTIRGTFDNGATIGEARYLARAFRVTQDEACRIAVLNAVDHILNAQYPTGGWPQYHPPGGSYHRHITFNDDTMINLMELLREVGSSDRFTFVDDARRQKARAAFDAGVACILKCQIVVDGKKTVWCAQHDEKTLEPRPARTFEPVSLSGSESAGILMLLMSLERPSREIVDAVEAGVRWFEAVKITGVRQTKIDGDKVITADPTAPPLWARFYEIGTNRPIFCGRDGVIRYSLAEISAERRNGYAWYGDRGMKLLKRYSEWAMRDSNPRRPACKAGALPTELIAHLTHEQDYTRNVRSGNHPAD